MKHCARCKTYKPLEDFPLNKKNKDGHKSWCKKCCNEHHREWRKNNPERIRELAKRAQIKRFYGITVTEYEALMAKGCALCGENKNMHLDHNHVTGKIREPLCQRCNQGIGLFRENPELLIRAAIYLHKFAELEE
jgi:Recombination endonuclease VII